ncbi:MAG: hypothetical protein Kow009_14030 [Spirochaetales bacterium]
MYMSAQTELRVLEKDIEKSLEVLAKIERFYEEQKTKIWGEPSKQTGNEPEGPQAGRTQVEAILFAEILVNYYTCLETIFFRVAQFFENHLSKERWHQDLLDRMAMDIPEVRPRILTDETARLLRELLRFRHFKRYYFEFEYDWDRLEFVRKKFETARPRVRVELQEFLQFLRVSAANSEHGTT